MGGTVSPRIRASSTAGRENGILAPQELPDARRVAGRVRRALSAERLAKLVPYCPELPRVKYVLVRLGRRPERGTRGVPVPASEQSLR